MCGHKDARVCDDVVGYGESGGGTGATDNCVGNPEIAPSGGGSAVQESQAPSTRYPIGQGVH